MVVGIDADTDHCQEGARILAQYQPGAQVIVAAVTDGPELDPALADTVDIHLTPSALPSATAVRVADPAREITRLETVAAEHPTAALSLAWLLRSAAELSVPAALAMESATYSTLLGGADFRRWLARRGAVRDPGPPHRLDVDRVGDELVIRLARPERRNAVDARMRDALLDALLVGELDPTMRVTLCGMGPVFCAGGDLDEFGTATDLAQAHIVRTAASAGAAIWRIAERVTARVHGKAIGAGLEIPAFAGRLEAVAGTEFHLPEVSMGLIPGAGGTVSVTRRVGRHRALWLALTGERITTSQAREWGLVDAVI
ncbi:MAG: enoyl-CoA hydratase/isomerase family protein [Solirubrobacterales bacterium]|nr:enoyl-CoA hydratase/isomerase family protein [Solirubrobacterales bacterium]